MAARLVGREVPSLLPWLLVLQLLQPLTEAAAAAQVSQLLDRFCVGCICEGASRGCDQEAGCGGGQCGPFRITAPYFQDAQAADSSLASSSYEQCTSELSCAARALRAYMGRFARDCDGDGRVTCTDLAMIHRAGPSGCSDLSRVQQTEFFGRFSECNDNFNID